MAETGATALTGDKNTAGRIAGGPDGSGVVKIVLISTNAGTNMGGEAMKTFQFFRELLRQGFDAVLVTHARNRAELEATFPTERLILVEDTPLQVWAWRNKVMGLLPLYFHLKVARLVRARFDPARTVLHYLCPVSPVAPRFPPRGFKVIMGPFTGNIYFPKVFADKMTRRQRLASWLHMPTQRLLGLVLGDKRRADRVLVSGYERTRASLIAAGCDPARLVDVVDSGVSERIAARPRIHHEGVNPHFVSSGRHDLHKGFHLSLMALARTRPDITLTIFGDGMMRPRLESLTDRLGLRDRVRFEGWQDHEVLLERLRDFRGYVFPSMAEANGIVVQEAMMLGLPVIALRWGGPMMLGDAGTAHMIEVTTEEAVIDGIARAMERLAHDGAHAESLSQAARARAEARDSWDRVAASWTAEYAALIPGAERPACAPGNGAP